MPGLYEGLPLAFALFLTVAVAVIAAMLVWTGVLFVRASRYRADPPDASIEGPDRFTWVFLVPALNEEVTIRDSVQRLLDVQVSRRRIVVIDDGSDDGTPEVLAAIDHPDVHVLRRDPPHAREGKAAALNFAYRSLDRVIEGEDRASVIVAVVDADGRLEPYAPSYVAAHLADPRVAGVQALVRVYNRGRVLTWLQDLEFSVYGCLYQAGRNAWGTAGMGGNGQFNRLGALDEVADARGPWRDRLTEDQDLGLRLIAAGWTGRQDLRAVVHQQGPPKLRALFSQRTRWSQGNLQAIGLIAEMIRAPIGLAARLEQVAYLLMPLWQGLVGAAVVIGIALAVVGIAPFWGEGPEWWRLAIYAVLAFGGTLLGCVAASVYGTSRGWLAGILVAPVYAFYTWFLWPVLFRSVTRQLISRDDWTKTEREPVLEDTMPVPARSGQSASATTSSPIAPG
jgi:cellulose synthase/poly-beta-1,6-N-acetylglucosamine synthase-like glycosyltransferase